MTTPLRGVAAAPGVARARIWRLPERSSEDASSGSGMGLEEAAERAAAELESLQERLRSRGREEESEIFGAQAMMAQDPELLEAAQEAVDQGTPPEQAIRDAAESAATALAALDDELLAGRAAAAPRGAFDRRGPRPAALDHRGARSGAARRRRPGGRLTHRARGDPVASAWHPRRGRCSRTARGR